MPKENWENIHKGFGGDLGKWCQERWQDQGFDYQETKAWMEFGLAPQDSYITMGWKIKDLLLNKLGI